MIPQLWLNISVSAHQWSFLKWKYSYQLILQCWCLLSTYAYFHVHLFWISWFVCILCWHLVWFLCILCWHLAWFLCILHKNHIRCQQRIHKNHTRCQQSIHKNHTRCQQSIHKNHIRIFVHIRVFVMRRKLGGHVMFRPRRYPRPSVGFCMILIYAVVDGSFWILNTMILGTS
jgi:hypothetical protein